MTSRQYVYLALAIVGTIVPYASLVPWLMEHGLDLSLMVEELFSNRISAFFGLDVIVSAALPLFLFLRESAIQAPKAP